MILVILVVWLLGMWPTAYVAARWGRLDDEAKAFVIGAFWPIVMAGLLIFGPPLVSLYSAIELANKHRMGK